MHGLRAGVGSFVIMAVFLFMGFRMAFFPEQSIKKVDPNYTKESQIAFNKKCGIICLILGFPILILRILIAMKMIPANLMTPLSIGTIVLLVVVIVGLIAMKKKIYVPVDQNRSGKGTKAKKAKEDDEF